jgi:ketosteroid isomerase-like protein
MAENTSPRLNHEAAVRLVVRFNEALNAGDVDGMMRLMSEDCVFENTVPAPDGTRYSGQEAVRAFWQLFFSGSRSPHIEIEEIFALGERCVMRWVYSWLDSNGNRRRVRGVDVYHIRDGLIAEKLSYVKG